MGGKRTGEQEGGINNQMKLDHARDGKGGVWTCEGGRKNGAQ